MRGKKPTPPWEKGGLFSPKDMYEMSLTPGGLIACLRRGPGYFGRLSTYNNLHLLNGLTFSTPNGFPIAIAYNGPTEFNYLPVKDWKKGMVNQCAIHGFGEDKTLDSYYWQRLEQTTNRIKDCQLLIAPDFSLFVDPWLDTFNRFQVFKSRVVCALWQACGLPVVPLVSWGNVDSFEYCLEGLPMNSVLALSATSCKHCRGAWNLWKYAVITVVNTLHPTRLIIYGDPELKVPVDIPVTIIPDYIHNKLRKL